MFVPALLLAAGAAAGAPQPSASTLLPAAGTPLPVALLISGQSHRAIYNETFARIGGMAGLWSGGSGEAVVADVFVVFSIDPEHDYAFTPSRIMVDVPAPLPAEALSETAITAFYHAQGARTVKVHLPSAADVDNGTAALWDAAGRIGSAEVRRAFALGKSKVEASPELHENSNRTMANSNMIYLRHIAMRSALAHAAEANIEYAAFLYLREDNVFLPPGPQLMPVLTQLHAAGSDAAMMHLDSHCPQNGPSDKIYMGNRKAMSTLFGASFDDVAHAFQTWYMPPTKADLHAESAWIASHNMSANMTLSFSLAAYPRTEILFGRLLQRVNTTLVETEFARSEARRVTSPADSPLHGSADPHLCVVATYVPCVSDSKALPMCMTEKI